MPIKFRLNYLLIPLFVIITASAASHFADAGLAWYRTINIPGWIFSNLFMLNIWIIIFVFTSISILIIWNRYSKERNFSLIIALFILNAIINVGWSILFYTQQQLGLALFESVLLVFNISLLIGLVWRFCPLAACMLFPYSVWVIFTTVLTFNVWMMN
ncbi:MAG: tryptophan-rich sensory protein [Ignavibacteriaceae bacterium]|nr:tryptophan-rich sensory protein [Ignavibacteriaceae bacterium]